jgi:hypothetical protein
MVAHTCAIPALIRLSQEDHEFKTSLGYSKTEILCFQKKKKKAKIEH